MKKQSILSGLRSFVKGMKRSSFVGSEKYWDKRYAKGGGSGMGSYGHLAQFKAKILNAFVADNAIQTVIEWGCGDGNQLSLADYPSYLGFDVSEAAIKLCNSKFNGDDSKSFKQVNQATGETADLAMSLDVVFHLVEDDIYHAYMKSLFASSCRYVVIFSSNTEELNKDLSKHVRHRKFTDTVDEKYPDWALIKKVSNEYPYNGIDKETSFSDFYFFEKKQPGIN